jgi:hypothetical protein
MTKTEIAKKTAKFVVGLSVGFTTRNVIKNAVDTEDSRRKEAEAAIGGLVLGSMAAEHAESWTDRKIDALIAKYEEIKNSILGEDQ